ncbi:DER1-domain-containing protein [Athelia psychrophila]|uniref:Derlin n=1 Tax=Athelia psychrophila TaxID=1759441 RepID=A0A165WRX6_9AGAM|nr:DER1-domain-containing protein [Fibularhizoctonia sp. CBS 109695]
MPDIIAELQKIPPVTRFLCASSLAVTVPTLLGVISPYKMIIIWQSIAKKGEIWRIFTNFFYGGSGLKYLFDIIMLYINSNTLEDTHYIARSADYAWQLLVAASGILALTYPLESVVNAHPLLIALTYLSSVLAPPGTTSSIFGLITIPIVYYPYLLVFMDLLVEGPHTAATGVVGLIVGYAWHWAIYGGEGGRGPLHASGRAPGWLQGLFERPFAGRQPFGGRQPLAGVHISAPRERTAATPGSATTGHRWGKGRTLGS